MVPAQRLYWALLAPFALAIVDALSTGQLLNLIGLALLWDGVLLGLAIWDSQHVQPVTVTRQPLQRLSIGRENPVQLTVQTGDRPAVLHIRDYYPSAFTAHPAHLQVTLPAHHQETLTYSVTPLQRGEYTWGRIQVRQLGRWGLAWRNWSIAHNQTVEVYPDLIGLRSLSIRLALQTSGNIRRARQLGMGTEFAELREYSTGDDPRLIDWKATARRGRPLLRVLEPEQEQTLLILLDRGRLMTAQVNGLARFDWGLNAALALALAGLNRGDRVGVGVFDRSLHTWIPPERGQPQLAKLIERLTPIQPVLMEPDYSGAITAITRQQTRRALVVLLTDIVDKTASAELLAAMARLTPRYLPFCVTLRDAQVDRQAEALTETVPSTYTRAVAIDLLNQRQVALATLQQKGVLILDAPAHQISEQLVDRYLHLKARGRL